MARASLSVTIVSLAEPRRGDILGKRTVRRNCENEHQCIRLAVNTRILAAILREFSGKPPTITKIPTNWASLRKVHRGTVMPWAMVLLRRLPTVPRGDLKMKKIFSALTATAIIAGTLAATATDASAQWRRGWGPGF